MSTGQFYMCYVQGGNSPTREHETYESAVKEANRLALQNSAKNLKVYVLKPVAIVELETPPLKLTELK